MSDKKSVITEALQLSDAERLEIADALYQSVDGPPDADAEQAWDAEIGRRVSDLDAGRGRVVPWPQARRQIAGDDADGGAAG